MSFTDEQLRSLATNPEAPTSTVLLARELMDLRKNPRDAYHTMEELYEQRMLWNAVAAKILTEEYPAAATKSFWHHDGAPCFGVTEPGERWFIVTVVLPNGYHVTQHYPERDWDLFDVLEVERAPHWDGHIAAEGNARLRRYLMS